MSDLFKLVTEKALENTDTVIAEKVHPVLGALGIASLAASAVPTINAIKKIDNIKNYFTKSESNMGKAVEAEQLKTGYGITYTDSKGNKLIKKGGDISILANNPGNIALPKTGFGPKNKQKFKDLGAIGWFVGKTNVFAIFPDEETGKKALYTWFFSGDRDNWTIERVMNVYAPASENDTDKYLKFIEKHGISPENKLSDLSERQQDILISAIIKMEGKNPVKSEQFIPAEPKLTNDVQKVSVKESVEYNSKSEKIEMGDKELNRFYKWFGNSKVVDKQGRPLVVYHGTNAIFQKFNKKFFGHYQELGEGFYFTADESDANDYGTIIIPFYLRIENPFIASKEQLQSFKDYTKLDFEVDSIKEIEDIIDLVERYGKKRFSKALRSLGFDGIILYGQYVVFNANQMKAAEYGNDGHYRRSSNNFNESITLNEATGIPTYQDDGEKYFYAYYCFTESELLNLMDSTFKYENIRVAYEFNKKVYLVSGTSTSIHYNIIFLAATETSLFDFIPEIKENKNADEDTIQELIKQYLYIAPFKIYRNDKKISDKEFIKKLFGGYNENIDDGYDMACKLNDTKWAVCRSDEFGDVKQVPLFQGKEWISLKEINAKLPNDEGKLNESSIPMWDDNIEDYITGAFYCFTGNELQSILDNNLHHEDARVIYEFNKGVYLLTESINAIHNQILEMAIINTKLFDSLGDIKQIKEENEGQVTLICEEARKYLDLITFKIFRNMETDTDEQFLEFLVRLPDNWTDDYSEGFACKLNNTTWAICRYNELNKIKQIPIFNGKKWISLKEINERLSEDEEELNESVQNNKVIAYRGLNLTDKEFEKQFSFEEGKPQFFSKNINVAASFGDFIYECELQLNKPLDITNEKSCYDFLGKLFNNYKKELQIALKQETNDQIKDKISYIIECIDNRKLWKTYLQDLIYVNWDKIIETAKQQGFDSIISKEESNDTYSSDKGYIIWSNKNIKRILNKYYYDWEDTYNFITFDEYKNKYLSESQEEVKKIIAYHGSQQKRIKFNKDKVLYLTRDYNQAKSYAIREWDEGLIEGEIPVIFKFEVSIKKPFITDGSEDSFFDFCDEMMVKEGRKNELISQGYDSIIHNGFIGVFFENQLKLLDTEILPWNPKYYYPEDGGINWEDKEDYYYFDEYDNEDLNESVKEDDNKTWIDIEDIVSEYTVFDVLSLFQEENPWNPLIDAGQYKKALEEFVKTGKLLRTPTSLIENWFEIIVRNTKILDVSTELSGHTQWFPFEEVKDYYFGDDELSYQEFLLDNKVEKGTSEYEIGSLILNKKGFYEKMVLPDGSDAISDYGLKPLYDIIYEYKEGMTAEEVLVLINKALDVVHCRGDLASAFIKGGRDTLTSISNESKKEIKKPLNESKQLNKKVIAYHGSQTDKLQFMKNHALYLTDNYELAHEFATKDGDGGLIDGEIATLYTCELNLKKVYETYSEAEYDSNFIDVSFNREKWLEKGYNAIIIHPTEASPTTYYIMLNPEEDVKIIDKLVIDFDDLLNENQIMNESLVNSKTILAKLVNNIDFALRKKYTLKLDSDGKNIQNKQIKDSYYVIVSNPNNTYKDIKFTTRLKFRCSNHIKTKDREDIDVFVPNEKEYNDKYLLSDKFHYLYNYKTIDEYEKTAVAEIKQKMDNLYTKIKDQLKAIDEDYFTNYRILNNSERYIKYQDIYNEPWFKNFIAKKEKEFLAKSSSTSHKETGRTLHLSFK